MSAVLVFHSGLGMPGGALAVSQFFTLSGFLITALVLRRPSFGKASGLVPFWVRRYRRLAPAALVTIAGALLFVVVLGTEQQRDAVGPTALAAIGQVVNWHFVIDGVSVLGDPSPLQHFWSLAIEEQFYLAMPLALFVLVRTGRSLRFITAVFAVGALASTSLMFALHESGVSVYRLYYGTDTRAAEILIGCVLALVLHQRPLNPGPTGRRAIAIAGVAAAVLTYWAWSTIPFTDPRLYTGGLFLHAIASAIMVVTVLAGTGPVNAVLSVRPLVELGRISYAVYCFHWPIYLLLSPERAGVDGWMLFGLRAAVTVALAALSGKFIEAPIRYGRGRRPSSPRLLPGPGLPVPAVTPPGSPPRAAVDQRDSLEPRP